MDLESVNRKYALHPKRFGRIEWGEDFYNRGPLEINSEETRPLTERHRRFSALGGRIRHLANGMDSLEHRELEDAQSDMREYRFSTTFDKDVEVPFLTLTAFYSPNAEEHTQTLLPIGERHYPEGTEAAVRILAEWWPPIANSREWGAPERHPYVATGYNDYYKYVGRPIARESLDITQLADAKRSEKLLTLIESSILEAEKQHGKNILHVATDAERYRLLDKISPIIGNFTVTGRWAFSDEVNGGPTDNLETPFQGLVLPIRGVIDEEDDEHITLQPGKRYNQLEKTILTTSADLMLSLSLAGMYEQVSRLSDPLMTHQHPSELGRLPAIERRYITGVPASGSLLGRLDGSVDVFSEPVGSADYYNPKLRGRGRRLLAPLDREVPHDPSGGMLPLPADKEW